MKETFVLAGDKHYLDKIETTLKSILYHHHGVKIYVFNNDISPEWFREIGPYVEALGSELVDAKLFEEALFQNWPTERHINYMTYARYFIPKYVSESRVLYLDCDLVLEENVSELFELDLQGKALAAVKDHIAVEFNAGVLLIDNAIWKSEETTEHLIALTGRMVAERANDPHFFGDQTVLNHYFANRWLPLDIRYNVQCGHDVSANAYQWENYFNDTAHPKVIHYLTSLKPWDMLYPNRFAERWWFYYRLAFSEIFNHRADALRKLRMQALVFTSVQEIEQIEFLAKALPEVAFHIAAYTDMGPLLVNLTRYRNVHLHPSIPGAELERLTNGCDFYLDINHGPKHEALLSLLKEKAIPIFAFDNTVTTNHGQERFPHQDINLIVKAIRALEKRD